MQDAERADVVIVGYGPIGQLLAVLLAQRGWRTTVIERWPQPYPMPRAVAFDGESARILGMAGIGTHIREFGEPSGDYTWLNADGLELLHYEAFEAEGLSGWPDSTSMYQPGLEAALTARGAQLPRLTVLRGWRASGLTESADGVELIAEADDGHRLRVEASWIVGCDGANSFVRGCIGAEVIDLGLSHDWLICDVIPHPGREFKPNNLQICDPSRPRTAVSAGPGHRRWEFMLLAGEKAEDMDTAENAWRMLSEFDIDPGNAVLERHAVYTFAAGYTDTWRSGRMLLAGDAAHLMPPFAAQGMSSGFRDVANLSWKLDLVLAGLADDGLLDSYPTERREHVQHAIAMSVNLGRIVCQTDPRAAADRDALMMALRDRPGLHPAPRTSAVQMLKGGVLSGSGAAGVGELTPHSLVGAGGAAGMLDELVGSGFRILSTHAREELLSMDDRTYLDRLGAQWVPLHAADGTELETDPPAVVDLHQVYLPYLEKASAVAAVIRPDFYLFGTAGDRDQLARLIAELRAQLGPGS